MQRHRSDWRWTARAGVVLLAGGVLWAGFASPSIAAAGREGRPDVYAITGARILAAPGKTIERGGVVIRDGLIEAVGANIAVPPDAVVIDAAGMTLHAGLINACARAGGAEKGAAPRGAGPSDTASSGGVGHPIPKFHPERREIESLAPSAKEDGKLEAMGFTAELVFPDDGIFRGTSALISLGDKPLPERVIRADVAQHVAFEQGSFRQPYPTSLMGVIASIRQAFMDAARHQEWESRYEADPAGMPRPDLLSAYAPLARVASGDISVIFEPGDPDTMLRAIRLADELHLGGILLGNGAEYEILDDLRTSGRPVILPLAFPKNPEVDDADDALEVDTRTLRRFVGARSNAAKLDGAGIPFALGTCGLEDTADFAKNLRKAIEAGLGAEAALAALTTVPAKMFGVDRSVGTVEAGKAADLVVIEGDLFGEDSKIKKLFVDGVAIEPAGPKDTKKKRPGPGAGEDAA